MFILLLVAHPGLASAQAKQDSDAEQRPVVGEKETVILDAKEAEKSVSVLAKVDTGATYSSVDYGVARDLNIDLDDAEVVTIQSSLGEDRRRLIDVRLSVAGRSTLTKVTVADRDDSENKMLLGRRDLEGFLVDVSQQQVTQPDALTAGSRVAALLSFPPPPPAAPTLLATLPLAAALVVALRVLVGMRTFGLFAPVLLAVTLAQTGIPAGLIVFGVVMAAGTLIQPVLSWLKLPRVARLAVLVGAAATTLVAVNGVVDDPAVSATWAAAFPVVVTATIMERAWDTFDQEGLAESARLTGLTLAVALLVAPMLVAEPVKELADDYPIILGLAGAAAAAVIGRYRGLRLLELYRFRPRPKSEQASSSGQNTDV